MKLKIFQVDAFAKHIFSGNPAAVIPLENWLPDESMQHIAMENNLSETAFFVPSAKGFHIRWFTPVSEVNLCGHATLATAHVLFNHLDYKEPEISFKSKSGILKVQKKEDQIILDFPASSIAKNEIKAYAGKIFGKIPRECFRGREDLMFVFNTEEEIKNLEPDLQLMKTVETRGIIVTASSTEFDFVSRFFAPAQGIDEDPVTGSAHTMLIPYWAGKLKKKEMVAKQLSKRGGVLYCSHLGERVLIGGAAITYLSGELHI
jgi:PhzF family phenazine biosynthesis protein